MSAVKLKRVSFLYTNGDKKRKEYLDVVVAIDSGCLVIGGVKGQDPRTLYLFPLSTITCIKFEQYEKEEAE